MLNLNSYNNHNREYEKGESLERERVAHEEHNSDEFQFLYQDDIQTNIRARGQIQYSSIRLSC